MLIDAYRCMSITTSPSKVSKLHVYNTVYETSGNLSTKRLVYETSDTRLVYPMVPVHADFSDTLYTIVKFPPRSAEGKLGCKANA